MVLAALLFAAIMTEKNGTFADAPAGAAVSVSSQYIPYGTFTDGSGSTEYMRVTTNLVGAVASMIDGLWERVALPYGWLPEDLAEDDDELKYPLRETVRDSKRIFATAINYYGSDWYGSGLRNSIEETLANGYVYETWELGPGGVYTYKTNAVHAGIAGSTLNGFIVSEGLRFREYEPVPIAWTSRRAEDIFGDPEPPISKTWSATLPFLTQHTDTWQRVFSPYSAYEYDPHIFQSNYEDFVAWNLNYARPHIRRWMMAEHVDDLWGRDVLGSAGDGAGTDLNEWLRKTPVATNAVMEEVLKVDPGFEYNYPPVETNSFWDVTGPLGSFHCELVNDYGPRDRYYRSSGTNYYAEVYISSGSESSWIDVVISQVGVGQVFYGWDYYTGDDTYVVYDSQTWTESYTANCTRFYADADDFKHWRNMTTRLDWKRLAIIAQLERQLEITYRVREREDYLPLWEFLVRAHRNYTGSLPLHIKIEDGEITEAYVVGHAPSLSLRYASWAFDGESAIAETNRTTSSYPTARTVVNLDGSAVGSTYSPASGTFDVRDDVIFEAIAHAIARFVNPWPADAKRISVDLNVTAAGISVATIFVWFGPDDVRSFSAGDAPVGSFLVPDTEVDDTFALSRDDAKIARDITTMANNATQEYKLMKRDIPAAYPAEMSETAVSNLESRLWRNGYIKNITLPTIEVRLAATNDYWAAQRDAEPAMPWLGEIGETNVDIRAFRYQCDVKDSVGLDNSRGDRLLSLRDLDSEVKKHFKKFAGRDITSGLAGRAAFNAAEIAAFEQAIANENAVVRLDKQVADARLVFEAEFNFDNGWKDGDAAELYRVSPELGTNLVRQIVYSTTNYTAHAYGDWSVNVSASAYPAITNSGIRVDGHQNQMMKTLWKFKNMRDPNL